MPKTSTRRTVGQNNRHGVPSVPPNAGQGAEGGVEPSGRGAGFGSAENGASVLM